MLYKNIYYTDCKLLNTLGRRDSEAGDPIIIDKENVKYQYVLYKYMEYQYVLMCHSCTNENAHIPCIYWQSHHTYTYVSLK